MRTIQKKLQEKFKELAVKHGVSLEDVMEVESAEWKSVKEFMAEGRDEFETFENIYLRYFGTIHASSGVLKYIKKRKDAEDTRDI